MDKEKNTIRNLYLLAKNYTGLPAEQLTDYPLYQDAYKSFDELIYSSLIYQQKDVFLDIFDKYEHSDISDFSKEISDFAVINEKIFIETISGDKQKYIMPGSIFEILNPNGFLIVPDRPDKSKSIAIELTPPCDFSNKKLNSKLIGGFIDELPSKKKEIHKYINKFKSDSRYLIWPVLAGNDKPQLMCFDFKCLLTVCDTDLENTANYMLIMRAKHSLFSDILQKFSSHSARLGIACLQPK
jgi:hypothetical protein